MYVHIQEEFWDAEIINTLKQFPDFQKLGRNSRKKKSKLLERTKKKHAQNLV